MRRLVAAVLFAFVPLVAYGTDRFISPTGTDAGSCTSSGSPCLTFSYAMAAARLVAGDTLYLANGTYGAGTSTGLPRPVCNGSTSNDGTAGNPITIRATNERQAFIDGSASGNGLETFELVGCEYWTIHGLRMRNGDQGPGTTGGYGDVLWIKVG
jgi:hypothetical protein